MTAVDAASPASAGRRRRVAARAAIGVAAGAAGPDHRRGDTRVGQPDILRGAAEVDAVESRRRARAAGAGRAGIAAVAAGRSGIATIAAGAAAAVAAIAARPSITARAAIGVAAGTAGRDIVAIT